MTRRFSNYLESHLDEWTVVYRVHATQRMFRRFINESEVKQLFAIGTIIEEYQDDFPFPSVLVSGLTGNNRPLHAVVGIDVDLRRLYLITIYEPDPQKWSENYNKRLLL